MLSTIISELIVKDIEANITFFVDNFNFIIKQKEIVNEKIKFVELSNGGNSLYLQALEFPRFTTKLSSSNLILFQLQISKVLVWTVSLAPI